MKNKIPPLNPNTKSEVIGTRVPLKLYNRICKKALAESSNPNQVVNNILTSYFEDTNETILLSSIQHLISKIEKTDRKVNISQIFLECFITTFFASHPEIKDEQGAMEISKLATARTSKFMTLVANEIKNHESRLFSALLMDSIETDGNGK